MELSNYMKQRQAQICFGKSKPKEVKKVVKIPVKSVKRKVEEKLYNKQKKEMLEKNPFCEINIEGVCTKIATGLHHLQKRSPKNYRERKNLVKVYYFTI